MSCSTPNRTYVPIPHDTSRLDRAQVQYLAEITQGNRATFSQSEVKAFNDKFCNGQPKWTKDSLRQVFLPYSEEGPIEVPALPFRQALWLQQVLIETDMTETQVCSKFNQKYSTTYTKADLHKAFTHTLDNHNIPRQLRKVKDGLRRTLGLARSDPSSSVPEDKQSLLRGDSQRGSTRRVKAKPSALSLQCIGDSEEPQSSLHGATSRSSKHGSRRSTTHCSHKSSRHEPSDNRSTRGYSCIERHNSTRRGSHNSEVNDRPASPLTRRSHVPTSRPTSPVASYFSTRPKGSLGTEDSRFPSPNTSPQRPSNDNVGPPSRSTVGAQYGSSSDGSQRRKKRSESSGSRYGDARNSPPSPGPSVSRVRRGQSLYQRTSYQTVPEVDDDDLPFYSPTDEQSRGQEPRSFS